MVSLFLCSIIFRDGCHEEGYEVRMGFFLHIPFPSFDIIRIFPWVDEILMGMLGMICPLRPSALFFFRSVLFDPILPRRYLRFCNYGDATSLH